MSEQLFKVISGSDTVKNLIFATWLRSYHASSPHTKLIPRSIFFEEHHKTLERIFQRSPTVLLAVMPEDDEVVLGYSVTENNLIHYVYTKPAFRKYGIAKTLLATANISPQASYTHYTYILRELYPHVQHMTYNPYKVNA